MGRRNPTRISPAYLERVTTWYLERWATTGPHLRRLLMTRVERSVAHHGSDRDEAIRMVDAEIARLNQAGLLDDARYATDKLQSLRRRGASAAKARSVLASKGISSAGIEAAMAGERPDEEEDPELSAAIVWARRHRVGPWRRGASDPELRRKELARMGRAGFGWSIVARVVDAASPEDLE